MQPRFLSPSLSTGLHAAGPFPRTGRHHSDLRCGGHPARRSDWRRRSHCNLSTSDFDGIRSDVLAHRVATPHFKPWPGRDVTSGNAIKLHAFSGLGQRPRPSAAFPSPDRSCIVRLRFAFRLVETCTYCQCLRRLPGVSAQLRSMPSKLRQAGHLPVATSGRVRIAGSECAGRRISAWSKGALCARTIRAPRSSWPEHPMPSPSSNAAVLDCTLAGRCRVRSALSGLATWARRWR